MKNLLIKEIRLASSPLSWAFTAFSLMALIPNYPILIGAFFVCFGIYHTFQNARENNDLLYTMLLPVSKTDAVKAKYAFTVLIQLIAFVLFLIFAVIRSVFFRRSVIYQFNFMMNANQIFLAWILVVFLLFNTIFVGGFFKTGWKIGLPFLFFSIASFVTTAIAEVLHHLKGLDFLNSAAKIGSLPMWGVTAAALVLWAAGTFCAMKRAIRRFEALDL